MAEALALGGRVVPDILPGPEWAWIALLLAAVLLAWHLTYTAARLDRLHTRVEGALSALDGQLVRRAETSLALASSGLLDPADALAVAGAAAACLDAGPFVGDTLDESGVLRGAAGAAPSGERVDVENALTGALDTALDDAAVVRIRLDDEGADLLDRLAAVGLRVHLARRFHADAVQDAVRVRRKLVVRVFRLAGHAVLPAPVPLDDRLPQALDPGRTMRR